MRRSARVVTLTLCSGVLAACGSDGVGRSHGGLSSTVVAAPAAADQDMIVLLRDQRTDLAGQRGARKARATALAAAQLPLIADLQTARPRVVRSFGLVNGFATKLSKSEVDTLSAHPLVQAVVPDAMIRLPKRFIDDAGMVLGAKGGGTSTASAALCDTLEPEALQLTNTAFSDPTVPQAQSVLDGNGIPVTGRGVTVGFLADGIDTTNPGFIRPDGSSVFVDYQDFSGDPAGTPTDGGEAFGDASSIAAQDSPNGTPLTFDISQFVNASHPLPSPCNIRIRGMAPGASLVGLKIFSQLGYTSTSGFVQAIEWAIVQDDVDVLNESFGSNPFPDYTKDPIALANQAAVRAGVTVTASTGDAGTAGTLGSPATNPEFIAAGASTQFRLYEQTSDGMEPLANGFLSDNVSSLSSGGFAQKSPRTVDVLAPGDLGWALCSTNSTLYTDCSNYSTGPTPIQAFGGTSEAAPLTAGAAALVIQAYRSTHGGADPTPALVKQILMSSASDLGASSDEEGAGRIDGLAAVQMALSAPGGNVRPSGAGLLASPSTARITAQVSEEQESSFQVTNTGAKTLHLAPALETLGAPFAGQTYSLQLAPASDPTFLNIVGAPRPYVTQTFTVPAGADHLDAAIALPPVNARHKQTIAAIALLDPSGRQAAYSIPQGVGSGYGHVDVVKPAAGQWTAIIRTTPTTTSDSYTGAILLTWSVERYVPVGNVYPSRVELAPGSTTWVTAAFTTPAEPGDLAAAIRFHDTTAGAATSEIPVTVRTLIPTGRGGGSFTATLTGGNGRAGGSPTQTFGFDVPSGVDDMSVALQVSDAGYSLEGFLIDPNGMALGYGTNVDPQGNPQTAVQLFRASPQVGRWLFVLDEVVASGHQTSLSVTGKVAFDTAQATATGLPTSRRTKLSATGAPVSVQLVVTNTGAIAKSYFADARLGTFAQMTLSTSGCGPSTVPGFCGYALLPTEANNLQFVAQSTVPLEMDAAWSFGSPDVFATQLANDTAMAYASSPELPYGDWYYFPAPIGPFGAAGAPTDAVTTTVTANVQSFDSAIASTSGDFWADSTLGTQTYNPLILAPGASGTITLTITPDPTQVGKTVSGSLYVDTYNDSDGSGDEVVSLPYEYTVTP
jgi:Subtilase family/Peptidase inhibitor I9